MRITLSMFPDFLAASALIMLSLYHFMIYWGRKKTSNENFNLYFSIFALSATLLIIAPYFQHKFFLYNYKPSYLNVINIEMFSVLCLFYSSIKFLNILLNIPDRVKGYFSYLLISISINFLATFSSNLVSVEFYFKYVLSPLLLVLALNVLVILIIYAFWIYRMKLYHDKFVILFFLGFVFLISNIMFYRSIELISMPKLLIPNHYFTVAMLYVFAYALSVKFNKEHNELKELKQNFSPNKNNLLSEIFSTKQAQQINVKTKDERFLQKALRIVETHIDDADFDISKFCDELNLSRTQVHRKMRAITGQSTTEYIRTIRLQNAAHLLKKNAGNVSEIAYQSGFNNLSYFTKAFKQQFSVVPSEYKG